MYASTFHVPDAGVGWCYDTYLQRQVAPAIHHPAVLHATRASHKPCAFCVSCLSSLQVRGYLDELHNKRMSPYEKIELLEAIRAQVQAAWRTDEIRRQKPTPQDEMRHGLSYFQETIMDMVPIFYR